MDLFSTITSPELPFSLPADVDYQSQWNEATGAYTISVPNGELIYAPRFFDKAISDKVVNYFLKNAEGMNCNHNWSELTPDDFRKVDFKNIRWNIETIKLYGKTMPLPRATAWYGDEGMDYTYSGIASAPKPWNEGLFHLKRKIETLAQQSFNSVLLNWYRNGEDYLNWHADDEKELGANPVIASVNFGETRDFALRRIDNHKEKLTIPLEHGTVLIMRGALQDYWQHSVPKRKKVKGSRFNLTFRTIHQ